MRALTEDEIWHDPWEEAAAEGAVRRWIEEKKHRSSTTLRITSTSSAIPLSSFPLQWQLLARRTNARQLARMGTADWLASWTCEAALTHV